MTLISTDVQSDCIEQCPCSSSKIRHSATLLRENLKSNLISYRYIIYSHEMIKKSNSNFSGENKEAFSLYQYLKSNIYYNSDKVTFRLIGIFCFGGI